MTPQPVSTLEVLPEARRTAPAPASLRRLGREAARYCRQTALRRIPLGFSWLERDWQLSLAPLAEPAQAPMDELQVDWGGAPVRLRLGSGLLDTAHAGLLGQPLPVAASGELLSVLTEAVLEQAFDLIERATRKRFRLVSVTPAANAETTSLPAVSESAQGYLLNVDDGEHSYHVELWLDAIGLGFLANALRTWPLAVPDAPAWAGLPVPARFCVGWTQLTLSALRSLVRHDVVLLDECLLGEGADRIRIRLGGRWMVDAQIEGTRLCVSGELEQSMDEFDEAEQADIDDGEPSALDDIPVRLQFDLGERMLPLAELQSISPGYVFELGRELRRAVTLRANGRVIGEGELVDVDGQVGVLVRQLTPPSV